MHIFLQIYKNSGVTLKRLNTTCRVTGFAERSVEMSVLAVFRDCLIFPRESYLLF